MNATTKTKSETPPDFETIVDDLATLKRDFAALLSEMKSGAKEGAEEALGKLGTRASDLYDSVTSQSERSIKAIERRVEERPIASVLIAFGIGFIASRLLSR